MIPAGCALLALSPIRTYVRIRWSRHHSTWKSWAWRRADRPIAMPYMRLCASSRWTSNRTRILILPIGSSGHVYVRILSTRDMLTCLSSVVCAKKKTLYCIRIRSSDRTDMRASTLLKAWILGFSFINDISSTPFEVGYNGRRYQMHKRFLASCRNAYAYVTELLIKLCARALQD